jgi:NitT/TauT family transport system substrate-binding protein
MWLSLKMVAVLFLTLNWASPASAEKIQLVLNWKAEPEFGGFYAAETSGAFKKQGLDVEILQGGAGTPVVQMIAAGKVDFGIVSADEIVIAQANGKDVLGLFAVFQTNPQGIMTHAERGFKNISDLFASDGILALQKGLPYAKFLLEKHKTIKAKIVPYAGGVGLFLADAKYSQQCFVMAEPLEAAKKKAKVKTFLVADEGYNPYTAVLATRGEVWKKNPKLVKSLVEAVRAGWREYIAQPDQANKVMAELNKSIDVATFKEITLAQLPLLESADTKANGIGHMTEARWLALTQQLRDMKLIEKSPSVNALFVIP